MRPNQANPRVLVLGFGNPGRGDDGLGPAAARAMASWSIPGWTIQENYQLNIEDAADVFDHDLVLFLDAAMDGPEPFAMNPVFAASRSAFSSHIVGPETILAICRDCFGRVPPAWLMAIRGYEFDLSEELTEKAQVNLTNALSHLKRWANNGCSPPEEAGSWLAIKESPLS